MTPTEELNHEHQVILKVLRATRGELNKAVRDGRADRAYFEKAIDFFRSFADRCHHAKEERHLFARLVEHGLSTESGPVAAMLYEHERGRAWVWAAAKALPNAASGDAVALRLFTENFSFYIRMLEAHIDKEDYVLYPLADRLLSAEEQDRLSADFARVEKEETGEGAHEKYHQLAHELAGA
ncbi:MAG: hemerythrin domain-containing protein [Candidatus Aminicenantes bacterium]|nr:hemerythrin domain-containing protein [Candidatus Aminicenantes bacterium]